MTSAVLACFAVAVVSGLALIGFLLWQRHRDTVEVCALVAELRSLGVTPDLTGPDLVGTLRAQVEAVRTARADL